jgi:hypothetical protein
MGEATTPKFDITAIERNALYRSDWTTALLTTRVTNHPVIITKVRCPV